MKPLRKSQPARPAPAIAEAIAHLAAGLKATAARSSRASEDANEASRALARADREHEHALGRGTDARLDQEVHDSLLDDACTNPRLDVLAAPVLEDDRVDALEVQQVTEGEPRRAGPDDADLGVRPAHALPASSSTRCAIANAPLAAGTPQ